MRETNSFPKCKGRRIWHIEKVHSDSDVRGGRPLRVVLERKISDPRGKAQRNWLSSARVSFGYLDLFVCARCGFAEWYASGLDGLVHCPEEGVHLLDAEPGTAPYR
jgi:hypothetical protein